MKKINLKNISNEQLDTYISKSIKQEMDLTINCGNTTYIVFSGIVEKIQSGKVYLLIKDKFVLIPELCL